MKIKYAFFGWLCISTFFGCAQSQEIEIPKKEIFHLYLLAGQSNMAGRGKVEPQDKEIHARVLTLNKKGEWVSARDPIHFDKPSAGVGPGRSFGIAMADADPSVTVGLIPCAVGGSDIGTWKERATFKGTNTNPYDDSLERVRRALKDGTLKGILWHQGESDATPIRSKKYEQQLVDLFDRFRKEFENPEIPIVVGQLGQFDTNPWKEYHSTIDAAHRTTAKKDPFITFVHSDGLTCKTDNIHFDSASMREFGRRYAKAYQALVAR
jgi:hypothetical protein